MLKRLIGAVIVKDDWVVQSIGYKKYRPIGRVEIVVENLDKWQLEEILIIDISRSIKHLGPNFAMLEKINSLKISTPLAYAGGIKSAAEAIEVIKSGADRVGIESLFDEDPEIFKEISSAIGKQAIILMQALTIKDNQLKKFLYLTQETKSMNIHDLSLYLDYFSELLVIDYRNEGHKAKFNPKLVKFFGNDYQLICFGGISSSAQIRTLLNNKNVSALAIGNFLNYKELANWNLLKKLKSVSSRQITYGKQSRGIMEWQ